MKKALCSGALLLSIAGAVVAGSGYLQRGAATAVDGGHAGHARDGISVAAEAQQLLGVRVSVVEKSAASHAVRLLGRVAPDEAHVYRINAGIDGFILEASPVATGSRVSKGQKLATFSAPSAISIIQTYIAVLSTIDRARAAGLEKSVEAQLAPAAGSNLQQRTSQLMNIGMSAEQLAQLEHTRQVPEAIAIVAPADGIVLSRAVSTGLKFERGIELYRLADLSRVWVLADVFQHDARHVRPGMTVKVSVPEQSVTLDATVAEVLPQFDATSRTLKVRLDVANPGLVLRPDMFVDVSLPVAMPAALTVPAEAVVDSGLAKTVFVERGAGVFEPRQVETGWRARDRVEIVKGLTAGERIATSGTFFLDSETRMRPPASGVAASREAVLSPTGHDHSAHGGVGHGQAQKSDHAGHGR